MLRVEIKSDRNCKRGQNPLFFLKKRKVVVLLPFVLLFLVIGYVLFKDKEGSYARICFTETCFDVEVSRTPQERSKGLMFREYLPTGEGMLFDFKEEGKHGIWMKNTLLTLDIVWINEDLEVVYIKKKVPPCTVDDCPVYKSDVPARFVLEVNSGEGQALNVGERGVLF